MVRDNTDYDNTRSITTAGFGVNRRTFLQLAGATGVAGALGISTADRAAAAVESVPVQQSDITYQDALDDIEYNIEHPRVYHTPEDVQVARTNAQNTEWGKQMKNSVIDTTHGWPFVEMTEGELRSLAPVVASDGRSYYTSPGQGGALTKGTVSPVDGSDFHIEYDKPGKVVDESGNVFPGKVDGVTLNDEGKGVIIDPADAPSDWSISNQLDDTQRFWFVAEYNGLITEDFFRFIDPAAYSYVLTDNDTYATTVATILDMLTEGFQTSFDYVVDQGPYPWFDEKPKRLPGKWFRSAYSVGRRIQWCVNAMDLIWGSGALEAESETNPGTTLKVHVSENLMVAGADWSWRDMFGGFPDKNITNARYDSIFENGVTDYNKTVLTVSSLLNLDVGYTRWALDGQVSLQNFLANTVFRDGSYYETSSLYQVSFLEWAELAYFLNNDTYPNGLNVYDNPRFINLNVTGPRRQSVAGRIPSYGDVYRIDLGVTTGPMRGDFDKTLRFYARATDMETRNQYAQTLAKIAGGDPNDKLGGGVYGYNTWSDIWQLFNIDQRITGFESGDLDDTNKQSELLEGKGMVMFRPEAGHARGAMLRYGETLNHGQYEELGLWLYGGGRDLSYDPGRHPKDDFLPSFLRQTVAHDTTVVNETSSVPPEDDGASVELFADRDGYTVADLSNPQAYAHEDIDEYRRTSAYVDVSEKISYLFDVFRVAGADTADFSFHGKGTNFSTSLDLSEPASGSVASSEYFWGDKITSNGNIEGHEDISGANVKPGNGYGFLGQPRSAPGDQTWNGTWAVDRENSTAKLRLTMLPDDNREIIVANAPDPLVEKLGLDSSETTLPYVLARNETPTSQFVSVIEPVGEEFPVESVEELDTSNVKVQFDPVAVKVTLTDGRVDYFLSTVGNEKFTAKLGKGDHLKTDATFAMVRTDGDGTVLSARCEKGTRLQVKFGGGRPLIVKTDSDAHGGTITKIDQKTSSLHVDADLPANGALAGRYLLVGADEYSHNSPYRIDHVESIDSGSRVVLEELTVDLSRGSVIGIEGNTVEGPVEFPLIHTEGSQNESDANEYFDGKQLVTGDGDITTIENTEPSYTDLTVADTSGVQQGDNFIVKDVKTGDHASVPISAEIHRENGSYVLNVPEDVDVKLPKHHDKGHKNNNGHGKRKGHGKHNSHGRGD